MEPKGDQRFYATIDPRQHVHLKFRDRYFDVMRFRSDVLSHYEKEDKKRFRAVQMCGSVMQSRAEIIERMSTDLALMPSHLATIIQTAPLRYKVFEIPKEGWRLP